MEQDNNKVITLSFVIAGALAALVAELLFATLAARFGVVARMRSQDLISHGLPILIGFLTFATLRFNPRIVVWADEVVTEVRKVVWPSRRDTIAMTTVCCVMLVIAGIWFGIFDFLSGNLVKLLVN